MAPNFYSVNTEELSLSLVDDLTQLCNRRFIYNNMPKILAHDASFAKRSCLFMIDVDNFKKINDTFGHLVGDMILTAMAKIIKEVVGEKGIVARYAGDEFLILLPGQGEEEARKIGEDALLSAAHFKWTAKDKSFTGQGISMGLAVYPDDGASMTELINCADQALYAAKRAGKSKIFNYKSVSKEIKDRNKIGQMLLRPPLSGREEELDNIKEICKVSEGGKKQGILVEGEPGIGKTRLLEEFAGWTEKQNIFFLFCKLAQKEDNGPLAILTELLRLVVNSTGANKFSDILAKLTPAETAEILYLYPAAGDLVKNVSVKIEPGKRADNLFSGLCKILSNAAGEKTLVLAVDGLHCVNHITLQFFFSLLEVAELKKYLFIGTYDKADKETLGDLLTRGILTTIKLGPLAKDEAARLIVSIFPDVEPGSKQVENIFKKSKGNPFLLCEILRNLVEKGRIQYEDGVWKLQEIGSKDIPDSPSDAIAPILGELDDETREMLSAVAVMGGKIERDILGNFSGYKEGYLLELLDRAVKAGVIKLPDANYDSLSFRNESARKALADKVPAQKAGSIHRKLAELIEQKYKDDLPSQLDRLIYHLDQGKEKGAALKYKDLSKRLNEEFRLSTKFTDILRKIEKQKDTPVSIEELLESPLSEASAKIIRDAILALRAAVVGTLLYPSGNNTRVDLENKAYDIMLKILKNDPTLTISDVEGKILVNGYTPRYVDVKNTIGFTLISLMEDYSISSITFKRDMAREEFEYLLRYLSKPEEEAKGHKDIAALLKEKGVSHIKIDQVRYEKLSEITKKIGDAGVSGISSISGLLEGSLLDMPVEQYSDPRISGKMGLIAEALILAKNNEKVESMVNKFSNDLNAVNAGDESAIAEGAIKLSESLLAYEKSDLLATLTAALLNRFKSTKQLQEFTKLCDGLQSMAIRLMDKKDFGQAGTIINRFKEQIAADSKRSPEQKKIVEEELHKIAHPKVVDALISAFKEKLKSDNPSNITDVLEALGEYALDSILNILTQEEIREKDPFELFVMRHSVAMILKKIGQPAKDALKKMLVTDSRNHVISNVIEVMGYIGSEEFAPLMVPFLHSDSLQIKKQSVVTLKKIGTAGSLKILVEAPEDKDAEIRQAVEAAITELSGKKEKK